MIYKIVIFFYLLGLPPPPSVAWGALDPTPVQITNYQQQQPPPTFFNRLEAYRQLAATKEDYASVLPNLAASTIASHSQVTGSYKGLVERTQDLRNWLQQAKSEHALLSKDAVIAVANAGTETNI